MKYDEIINLPHYEPKYHKRMSKSQRAAQFSPFSAVIYCFDVYDRCLCVVPGSVPVFFGCKKRYTGGCR